MVGVVEKLVAFAVLVGLTLVLFAASLAVGGNAPVFAALAVLSVAVGLGARLLAI